MNLKFIVVLVSFFILSSPIYAEHIPLGASPAVQNNVNNKINLNKADVVALTGSFKGIGKKRAEAIIAYRESHHGFKAVQELAEVKGLSQHFIDTHLKELSEVFTVS